MPPGARFPEAENIAIIAGFAGAEIGKGRTPSIAAPSSQQHSLLPSGQMLRPGLEAAPLIVRCGVRRLSRVAAARRSA